MIIINQSNFKSVLNQSQAPLTYNIFGSSMSEIEELTKSLAGIVSSLSGILSKGQEAGQLQPESTRVKKTPEMTYHQFLGRVLSGRDPLPVIGKKLNYRLQEDLELLYQLSHQKHVNIKAFDEIAASKKINRSSESLRSRYNDYLTKVGEAEMKRIVAWIEQEGLEGYITFQDDQLRLSLTSDPKDEKKEDKKRQRPASLDVSQKKLEKKKEPVLKKAVPTNCKELNEVLRLYSKMVNIPIKTLLERLDQLSGDFVLLDRYIETKDSRLLWSSQEDEILKKGGAEVQLLRKYRGSAVDGRRKYLGLN